MAIGAGAMIGLNAAAGLLTSGVQHLYNRSLSKYQNDMNIQNWNQQNVYNSPINQRKRLEEAGLNPALMYGNGSVSTGNAGAIPNYQSFGTDITNNILQMQQLQQISAQIKNTEAQTKNIEADTTTKEINNGTLDKLNNAIIDKYVSGTELDRASANYKFKELGLLDVNIEEARKRIELFNAQIQETLASAASEEERKKLLELQQGTEVLLQVLTQEQTEDYKAKRPLYGAQVSHYQADITLKGLQGGYFTSQKENLNAATTYQKFKNEFYRATGVFPGSNLEQAMVSLLGQASIRIGGELDKQLNNIKNFEFTWDNLRPWWMKVLK